MWNANEPLWLPPSSIRAIIAIMIVTAFITAVFAEVPEWKFNALLGVTIGVTGFYFVVKLAKGK